MATEYLIESTGRQLPTDESFVIRSVRQNNAIEMAAGIAE
jgi:hypothetical protein